MLLTSYSTFIVLLISFVATLILATLIYKNIGRSQLKTFFLLSMVCLLICEVALLFQIVLSNKLRN